MIINAAQKLLQQQFPNVKRQAELQLTLLVAANKCHTLLGGAIQIIHIQPYHWARLAYKSVKISQRQLCIFMIV